MDKDWYQVANVGVIPSPALLVYPDRVAANIRRAIEIVGTAKRLRPHIKTHKMPEIIAMHVRMGISKFKCATIAEAEMAARAGASDLLIATQLTGPNLDRLGKLRRVFPKVVFSTICDNVETAAALAALGAAGKRPVPVYLDVDCGMHRTGIEPGGDALKLYRAIAKNRWLRAAGLHVYDGHIHEADPAVRERLCEEAFAGVERFRARLRQARLEVPSVVAGGTPTLPFHARKEDRECSPGTYVFWDFGYQKFPDLNFQVAALVLARVISKPSGNRLCLDLGHKAIASENPQPRVQFLNLPNASPAMHSEEHLVLETPEAGRWKIGEVVYGLPRHICPTVALHDRAHPVRAGRAGKSWKIEARRRILTV